VQGNESRGRGDGLWSHPPKSYVCFFQISPILLTKGQFHHRTQRLAAARFNTTLPMVTLPFRCGKGIRPLLLQTVDPLSCRAHKHIRFGCVLVFGAFPHVHRVDSWSFQARKTLRNGRVFRVWNFFLSLHHLPHLTRKTRPKLAAFFVSGLLLSP